MGHGQKIPTSHLPFVINYLSDRIGRMRSLSQHLIPLGLFFTCAIPLLAKDEAAPLTPPFREIDGQRFWHSGDTSRWLHGQTGILEEKKALIPRAKILEQLSQRKETVVNLSTPATAPISLAQLTQQLQKSSVLIMALDTKGEDSYGSGFAIAPGVIVTNWHVVDSKSPFAHIVVMNGDGTVLAVTEGLAGDRMGDLAILKVDDPTQSLQPLPLAATLPHPGTEIWQCGNTHAAYFTVTKGIVSRYCFEPFTPHGEKKSFDMPAMDISNPVSAGSSGSALVNTAGEVVGIYYSRRWYYQDEKNEVKIAGAKGKSKSTSFINDRFVLFQRHFALPVTHLRKMLKQP